MKTPDKVYWSYLAALFDGEGTLSIYKNSGNYKKLADNITKQYTFTNHRVSIYNTNVELMEWLVSNFGGVYYTNKRRNLNHKIEYDWRPKGKANTEKILLGILPYLVIKNKQANIILEYIRLGQSCGTDRRNVERRIELMKEVQKLNQRGLSVTTNTLNTDDESVMRESDLYSDMQSAPVVMQGSEIVSDLA